MTKKFWESWKNRVYDTAEILLHDNGEFFKKYGRWRPLYSFTLLRSDEVFSADFKNDTVELGIRHFSGIWKDKLKEETFYCTLDRNEIKTVKFRNRDEEVGISEKT